MPYVIEHVKVENIQIELEQENAATWLKVLPYDGCGEYNEDRTMRYINWCDPGDDDEYPRQYGRWYKVGTLIPLLTYRQ